jgi:hypothetical protein
MLRESRDDLVRALRKDNPGSVLARILEQELPLEDSEDRLLQGIAQKAAQPNSLFDMLRGDDPEIGREKFAEISKELDLGCTGRELEQLFVRLSGGSDTISKRQFQQFLQEIK